MVWILLAILLLVVALITVILLLPFSFIITTDEKGELLLLFKFLNKTFGQNPDPNQPIIKTLKELSGINRLDTKNIKPGSKKGDFLNSLREYMSLVLKLLKELFKVIKGCKVKQLNIDIVCAEDDAAETAITYGVCCAVISPVIGLIHNTMKVNEKNEQVNISANFDNQNSSLNFKIILVTRVYKLLAALIRLIIDETKRISNERINESKKKS